MHSNSEDLSDENRMRFPMMNFTLKQEKKWKKFLVGAQNLQLPHMK